jgi:hypothetical protein
MFLFSFVSLSYGQYFESTGVKIHTFRSVSPVRKKIAKYIQEIILTFGNN